MARYRNSNLVVRSHWSQCQMAACRRRPCVWPCSSFRLLRLIGRTYGLGCSFGLIFVNNFQNVKIKKVWRFVWRFLPNWWYQIYLKNESKSRSFNYPTFGFCLQPIHLRRVRRMMITFALSFLQSKQCAQIAKWFVQFWPFTTMKIFPIYQSRVKIMPNIT